MLICSLEMNRQEDQLTPDPTPCSYVLLGEGVGVLPHASALGSLLAVLGEFCKASGIEPASITCKTRAEPGVSLLPLPCFHVLRGCEIDSPGAGDGAVVRARPNWV